MKQRIKLGKIAAVLVLASGIALSGCQMGMPAEDEEERDIPVRVTEVRVGNLEQYVEIVGVTKAEKEYSIFPKMSGELAALHVDVGDKVEPGQLLAELDDRDLRLAVEMEKASLDISRNQLENARSAQRQAELAAKASLAQTGEVDVQIEENIRQASLGVEQAEMNVRMTELRVRQAEERLNDTKIVSPGSGTVASVGAHVGELVSGQAPLFVIVSDETLLVEAPVSAAQLSLFVPGEEKDIFFPTNGETRKGVVRPLPVAAGQTGLYNVEIAVENDGLNILPGVPAKVRLPQVLASDAVLLPTEAIVESGDEEYVFVVRDGKAVKVPVQVLHAQTDLTAVEAELTEGEQVVIRGQLTLTDGASVIVMEGGK